MAAFLASAIRASRPFAGRRLIRALKPSHHIRGIATQFVEDSHGLLLKNTEGGKVIEARIPKLWLRDNCLCKECVNQATLQRSHNTFDIPVDITPTGIRRHEEGIDVTWSDSHESKYTWTWLRSAMGAAEEKELRGLHSIQLWNSTVGKDPPRVCYDSVMDKDDIKGMADLTTKIRQFGFCFVTDSPKTPEATESLLKAIGPIRNTHYGGFYDFLPDLAMADTAYTNSALSVHTDTTYFSEPVGLQAFHMLSHTPPPGETNGAEKPLGGRSILVDGFYAAHRMRREFRTEYEVLRTVRVPWHASGNQDTVISPDRAYPVLDASPKRINRIRWNNDDRGAVPLHVNVDEWYEAARRWDMILRRSNNEYRFQLEPGKILIFDNWRILHGRTAFEGTRRICGGYINRDDFVSRWQLSNFSRDEIIRANTHRK